jgi:hypothetical protein
LTLPESHKLKGAKNWIQWKEEVKAITDINALNRYINERGQQLKPEEVDEFDPKSDEAKAKAWSDWRQGDASMRLAITCNCKAIPGGIVASKRLALDMWKTLCAQYEGSGTVLEYNTVQEYIHLVHSYNNYASLQEFIIDFQKAIQKLKDLPDMAPPDKWHVINFIASLATKWPLWSERQRSNVRTNKDTVTLTSLIKDITDEARTKENSKASGSSALYGNKPKDQLNQKKKGKGDKKDSNKAYPHYKNPNPNHKADNCLEGNKKKREE